MIDFLAPIGGFLGQLAVLLVCAAVLGLPLLKVDAVRRPKAGRKVRGSFPIHGVVGPNGGGKSACVVWMLLPSLAAGRPVLSTVRILDFENPRPCDDVVCAADHLAKQLPHDHLAAHPLWTPFTRWQQLLEWRNGDVFMDEVTGVASSRDSHKMPGAVLNHLMQLRRADVRLFWTAPSWRRADTGIREVTQAVTSCKGFFKKRVPMADDGTERLWHHRRLFIWSTYDAYAFEDFTAGTRDKLKAIKREWHWGPGSPAFAGYDTFDQVLGIGSVTGDQVIGVCMTCDGMRRRGPCTCDNHAADGPVKGRRRGSGAGPLGGKPRSGASEGASETGIVPSPVVSDGGEVQ